MAQLSFWQPHTRCCSAQRNEKYILHPQHIGPDDDTTIDNI